MSRQLLTSNGVPGLTQLLASSLSLAFLALAPTVAVAQTEAESPSSDSTESPTSSDAERPRFTCEFRQGQYTVMYHPESQPEQSYPWAVPSELGGGWTPERRCNEIARRLEFYRPDGLVELGTGRENNYDIVCVTTEADPRCRIVFTVPPGQDPQRTRNLVFDNIVQADSGESTQPVNALVGNPDDARFLEEILGEDILGGDRPSNSQQRRDRVNLKPFLDSNDGGTGELLDRSSSDAPRLDPENFR